VTDLLLLLAFAVASLVNEKIRPTFLAYSFCVAYQLTLFDYHSAVINHVIYGLIFIPFCYFAIIQLSTAMVVYSTFHLFVSIDYQLYRYSDTFLSNSYNEIQIILALSLILIGCLRVDNGFNNKLSRYNFSGVVNIWNNQAHLQKKGRA